MPDKRQLTGSITHISMPLVDGPPAQTRTGSLQLSGLALSPFELRGDTFYAGEQAGHLPSRYRGYPLTNHLSLLYRQLAAGFRAMVGPHRYGFATALTRCTYNALHGLFRWTCHGHHLLSSGVVPYTG